MLCDTGIIQVLQIDENGERASRIDCPDALIPAPGKYILAYSIDEPDSVLGKPLFAVGFPRRMDGTTPYLLGPVPLSWVPGTRLHLQGPYGRGFHLPPSCRRIALAAFGESCTRILPLIPEAIESGADVALFTQRGIPESISLPTVVEINPLSALPEALSWANFLAIDVAPGMLPNLRSSLRLGPHDCIPCPTQVLITIPMPCGTVAECGACAVKTKKPGYKLVCKDGPVFPINQLDW
jgi:hypothetical protein